MFIPRSHLEKGIKEALEHNPGVVLLGPRQCGKTTIARRIAEEITPSEFFDLENPLDLARLDNPMLALEDLTGLIVLDEVQRKPDLFEAIEKAIKAELLSRGWELERIHNIRRLLTIGLWDFCKNKEG